MSVAPQVVQSVRLISDACVVDMITGMVRPGDVGHDQVNAMGNVVAIVDQHGDVVGFYLC